MAVLKNNRREADISYYYSAIKMREDFTKLLLRDFGIKNKIRNIRLFEQIYKMEEEDSQIFESLLEKYNLGTKIIEEYPDWFIHCLRIKILNELQFLLDNITEAERFESYKDNLQALEQGQILKIKAITQCDKLLQDMQYAIQIFPIDVEKLMPYVGKLKKEIELLSRWHKKGNKHINKLKERDKGIIEYYG